MPLSVIFAAAAVAASSPVLVFTAMAGRAASSRVTRNLTASLPAPTDLRQLVLSRPAWERTAQPVVAALARRARRLTPVGVVGALDRRLAVAGNPFALERVLAAKLVFAAAAAGTGILWAVADPSSASALLVPAAAVVGWLVPDVVIARRASERQQRILDTLPDVLDQLTVCVEAGLGFDAALTRVAKSGRGPLGEEIRRTLQDIRLGSPRGEALHRLAERADVAELRQFVNAITQAEEYGVPVAAALRTQALEQREKRCSRAEERAQKMPVKLVFPLVLCILPALFVVVLGPAALRTFDALLGG